ncbi:hypothetical protein ZWY2020_038279 [Hordeum vulgare]|nr:hypothetical protein ZWY2020_038279 [Hordeum vulgare]
MERRPLVFVCSRRRRTRARGVQAPRRHGGRRVLMLLYYRATRVPAAGEGRAAWLGMLAAELWYAAYWAVTQSVRWSPSAAAFKDRLAARLPCVDIFVCTADPIRSRRASIVSPTILSLMAYNYPPEKLSVYLSHGDRLDSSFLWRVGGLLVCKALAVAAAYFSQSDGHPRLCTPKEWSLIQEMTRRIDKRLSCQTKFEEIKARHKSFMNGDQGNHLEESPTNCSGQMLIDNEGNALPTLVYMAR